MRDDATEDETLSKQFRVAAERNPSAVSGYLVPQRLLGIEMSDVQRVNASKRLADHNA